MVALAAYFDDSKNTTEGIFAVAGYISTVAVWDELFTPAWWSVLGAAPRKIKEFKASDCRQRMQDFAEWERPECDALTERLVDVIVGPDLPSVVGLGAAVVIENFKEMSEGARERWERFAYLLCCGVVSHNAFELSKKYVGEDTIRIVFDEQDELETKVREIFKEVRSMASEEYRERIPAPMFEPSEKLAPLQAADLLAYETYKEMKNRSERPPRKVSKALERLVHGKLHHAWYFDTPRMLEIQERIRGGRSDAVFVNLPPVYNSVLPNKIRGDGGAEPSSSS